MNDPIEQAKGGRAQKEHCPDSQYFRSPKPSYTTKNFVACGNSLDPLNLSFGTFELLQAAIL